jgi:hypothetical protein
VRSWTISRDSVFVKFRPEPGGGAAAPVLIHSLYSSCPHKAYIYLVYQSVRPPRSGGIGTFLDKSSREVSNGESPKSLDLFRYLLPIASSGELKARVNQSLADALFTQIEIGKALVAIAKLHEMPEEKRIRYLFLAKRAAERTETLLWKSPLHPLELERITPEIEHLWFEIDAVT